MADYDEIAALLQGGADEGQLPPEAYLAALAKAKDSGAEQQLIGQQEAGAGDLRTMSLFTSLGQNPLLQGIRSTSAEQSSALGSAAARTEARLAARQQVDPLRLEALRQAAERLKLQQDNAAQAGSLGLERLKLAQQRLADTRARLAAGAEAARAKAEAKAQENAKKEEQGGFKLEGSLRKEFQALPAYKNYQIAAVALDQIQRAAQDPSAAGDLALITNFMRSLDPNTGVKDQEFNNAQNAGGMYDKAAALLARIQSGERLTGEQRASFLNAARSNVAALKRSYDAALNHYRSLAGSYKVAPDRVAMPVGVDIDLEAPGPSLPPAPGGVVGPGDPRSVKQTLTKDGKTYRVYADGHVTVEEH